MLWRENPCQPQASKTWFNPSRSLDSLKPSAAHRLRSDQEAIQTAQQIARELEAEASARDRERRLPQAEIELLTRSGLWGITIPKAFGGPGVAHSTLVEVFAILPLRILLLDKSRITTSASSMRFDWTERKSKNVFISNKCWRVSDLETHFLSPRQKT